MENSSKENIYTGIRPHLAFYSPLRGSNTRFSPQNSEIGKIKMPIRAL
jgi:hypothetical protein